MTTLTNFEVFTLMASAMIDDDTAALAREVVEEVAPKRKACDPFHHQWQDHYYGYQCSVCGAFVPFGSELWMPVDDESLAYMDEMELLALEDMEYEE